MTNYEMIKSFDVDEMAFMLFSFCDVQKYCSKNCPFFDIECAGKVDCDGWEKWLESEVKHG